MTPLVKRGLLIAGVGLLLAGAVAAARGRATRWKSGLTVESLSGGVIPTQLEVCANGHGDLGFVGEMKLKLGATPDDLSRRECVVIVFAKPPSVGTYVLEGDGERRIAMGNRPAFTGSRLHAPEITSVSLDTFCFCGQLSERTHYSGTLSLAQLEPTPRGRLTLEVDGSKSFPPASIDVALERVPMSQPGY